MPDHDLFRLRKLPPEQVSRQVRGARLCRASRYSPSLIRLSEVALLRRDWAAGSISGKDSHGKGRRDGQAPTLHTGYRLNFHPQTRASSDPVSPACCPAEMGAQATRPRCCDFGPQRSHHHRGVKLSTAPASGSWGQPRVSSLLGLQEPVGVGASPRAQIRALGVGGSRAFTEGQMRAAGTRARTRLHLHT